MLLDEPLTIAEIHAAIDSRKQGTPSLDAVFGYRTKYANIYRRVTIKNRRMYMIIGLAISRLHF